jgi:hypothetical protein
VPVSLRERGDRAARGRTSRVPDPTADRLRLTAEAEQEAEQRQAAAAELTLAGALHRATISPAARDPLLDLVAVLLAQQSQEDEAAEIVDHDAGPRLRAWPGLDTVVDRPLACTSGHSAAAGMVLLSRTAVRYHGDFEWPGIATPAGSSSGAPSRGGSATRTTPRRWIIFALTGGWP